MINNGKSNKLEGRRILLPHFRNESHKIKSGLKPRLEGEPVPKSPNYYSAYTEYPMDNISLQ
jgi:hypothetical protein